MTGLVDLLLLTVAAGALLLVLLAVAVLCAFALLALSAGVREVRRLRALDRANRGAR